MPRKGASTMPSSTAGAPLPAPANYTDSGWRIYIVCNRTGARFYAGSRDDKRAAEAFVEYFGDNGALHAEVFKVGDDIVGRYFQIALVNRKGERRIVDGIAPEDEAREYLETFRGGRVTAEVREVVFAGFASDFRREFPAVCGAGAA